MKRFAFYLMALISMAALSACTKEADALKPVEDARAEAQSMSRGALEDTARRYADAIVSKTSEYRKVEAQIKAIPLQDLMGKKATAMKVQAGALATEISNLNRLYDIYSEYYLKKGGDFEKIKIRR